MSFQIRQTAVVMVPLLGLNFVFEIFERIQVLQEYLTLYPELVIVAFVPMMALVYTLIPVLARFLWTVESFPKGHLRGRFEMLCKKNGVKIRDILLWRTGRASIINAAALGLFGRLRYVIITDGLLQHLSDSEVEAVFGHELGHAKHHHIATYAAFLIVISFLTTVIMNFAGTGNTIIDSILQLVLTFGIFIGLVFGFISRRFERQADMFGCKVVGDTMTFVNALEKVALYSGNVRNLRSWMHSSIEKRVRFLVAAMHYPEIGRRFQANVRMLAGGIIAAFALCLLGTAANFFLNPYESRILKEARFYQRVLAETQNSDERTQLQLLIAGEYEKAGMYKIAASYYDAAFRNEAVVENMLRQRKDDKAVAADLRDTARLFLKEGFPDTALPMVAMALRFERENPEYAPLTGDLAQAYLARINELVAAGARDRSYLDVSEAAPEKNDRLLQMAAAHALGAFNLAVSAAPADPARREMLARAYLLTGDYADAASLYRSVAENSPSPETLIWRGVAAGFAGDMNTAQEMLFVRAAGAPDRGLLEEARRRVALAFSFSAGPAELRSRFAAWGYMDPASPRFAHFYAAESLCAAGLDEAAVSAYLAAIGAFPENPYYRYRLGEVYLAKGNARGAAAQFERAALMHFWKNPMRKDFLQQAAAALRLAGETRRASSFELLGAR
jgi:Zn-dependent protease with chaperone function